LLVGGLFRAPQKEERKIKGKERKENKRKDKHKRK